MIVFLIKWIQTSCFVADENENISEGVNSYTTHNDAGTEPETNCERNSRGKSWKIIVLSCPWSSSSYTTHFVEGQYQPMGSSPKKIWWNLSLSMENVQSYTNSFCWLVSKSEAIAVVLEDHPVFQDPKAYPQGRKQPSHLIAEFP